MTQQVTKVGETVVLTEYFTYTAPTAATTSGQVATYRTVGGSYDITYSYTYDANGNITAVSDGTNTTTYSYDSANQLIREDNQAKGKSYTWTYDNAGNILSAKTYVYTTGELGAATASVPYTYGASIWKDLLTAYNGTSIGYDAIGNPLVHGTTRYTWEHGRQLATMLKNGTTWNYTYNTAGLRTGRYVENGTSYKYVYNGGQLMQMTKDNQVVTFAYDAAGTPLTMKVGENTYYYVTNLQGDITGLVNANGTTVASYSYTAYGVVTATGDSTVIALNPLTYRGYVYDTETGLYYLQSRYYDPTIGRFINADGYVSTGQGFVGNNMFAYCGNNPVTRKDATGQSWVIALIVIGVVVVCGGSMSGCSKQKTPPSDFVQDSSIYRNCYAYAFGIDGNKNPGDYSIGEDADDYMYKNGKTIYNIDEIADFVMRDMAALGKNVRIIASPDELQDGEYLVVMKTSTKILPGRGVADYHFAVQLSDGTWADKPGELSAQWNVIDGSAQKWDSGNIEDYYDTNSKYFAVKG